MNKGKVYIIPLPLFFLKLPELLCKSALVYLTIIDPQFKMRQKPGFYIIVRVARAAVKVFSDQCVPDDSSDVFCFHILTPIASRCNRNV